MMTNSDSPEKEYLYQGPMGALIFWLIWSVVGYGFLSYQGQPFSLLDLLYLVSGFLSIMALNNRKFGINHRIRLYKDRMIVPKVLNVWHPEEDEILFNDIIHVNFLDHGKEKGMSSELDYCEIEILTENKSYPILGRKLESAAFKEIYELLKAKVRNTKGAEVAELVDIEKVDKGASTFGLTAWQKKLGIIAIMISFVTIGIISVSAPFHSLIGGAKFFALGFALSIMFSLYQSKTVKVEKGSGRRWQKIFLLMYIAFYGGIGGAFSLIYVNGLFDTQKNIAIKVKVVRVPFAKQDKKNGRLCVELAPLKDGRVPASVSIAKIYNQPSFTLCRAEQGSFKKDQVLTLMTKPGFLGEAWISDIIASSNTEKVK